MVGFITNRFHYFEIGARSRLDTFYATVEFHLEGGNRGSIYPHIMNDLYSGKLDANNLDKGLEEIETIAIELKKMQPSQIIWAENEPCYELTDNMKALEDALVSNNNTKIVEVIHAAIKMGMHFNSDILYRKL